jgi:hypothetical protein
MVRAYQPSKVATTKVAASIALPPTTAYGTHLPPLEQSTDAKDCPKAAIRGERHGQLIIEAKPSFNDFTRCSKAESSIGVPGRRFARFLLTIDSLAR